jgi:hypothetical protein
MLAQLVKVANRLDSLGLTKEADILDLEIIRLASDSGPGKTRVQLAEESVTAAQEAFDNAAEEFKKSKSVSARAELNKAKTKLEEANSELERAKAGEPPTAKTSITSEVAAKSSDPKFDEFFNKFYKLIKKRLINEDIDLTGEERDKLLSATKILFLSPEDKGAKYNLESVVDNINKAERKRDKDSISIGDIMQNRLYYFKYTVPDQKQRQDPYWLLLSEKEVNLIKEKNINLEDSTDYVVILGRKVASYIENRAIISSKNDPAKVGRLRLGVPNIMKMQKQPLIEGPDSGMQAEETQGVGRGSRGSFLEVP